jgi:hypothetical protein
MRNCAEILNSVKIQYGKKEPHHGTVYGNVFDLVHKEIQLHHLDDFSKAKTYSLKDELERVKDRMLRSDYRISDNSIEERFNFSKMEVRIIDHLFR